MRILNEKRCKPCLSVCRFFALLITCLLYMALWGIYHSQTSRKDYDVGLRIVTNTTTIKISVNSLVEAARNSIPSSLESLEYSAILGAKSFKDVRPMKAQQKSLLCATFTKSDETSLKNVLENMQQMGQRCEWAVILYDEGRDSSRIRLLEHAAQQQGLTIAKVQVVENRSVVMDKYGIDLSAKAQKLETFLHPASDRGNSTIEDDPPYNDKVYPKTLQYLYLLDLLPSYQRVWLLDSDVTLVDFSPDKFFAAVKCAFPSPPLVAQPLISENTQSYKYLNSKSWKSNGISSKILASSSAFIEIQAPLVDADFFDWFLRYLVVPLLAPSRILGADWGFDALFCRSADVFTRARGSASFVPQERSMEIALSSNQPNGKTRSQACMIVVAGTPLHHVNKKVLDHTLGYKVKKKLNLAMIKIIQSAFPNLYKSGHDKDTNMLTPRHASSYYYSKIFQGTDPACRALVS